MTVSVTFESRERDESLKLGPFDWVEVDGSSIHAESGGGDIRHDQIAIKHDEGWITDDGRKWSYFVVSPS